MPSNKKMIFYFFTSNLGISLNKSHHGARISSPSLPWTFLRVCVESCRIKCSSHRHLRTDTEFTKLIELLFPDRAVAEADEDNFSTFSNQAQTQTLVRARLGHSMKNSKKKPTLSTKGKLLGSSSSSTSENAIEPRKISKEEAQRNMRL